MSYELSVLLELERLIIEATIWGILIAFASFLVCAAILAALTEGVERAVRKEATC